MDREGLSLWRMKGSQFSRGREETNCGWKQYKQLSFVPRFQGLQRLPARYLLVEEQTTAWLDWNAPLWWLLFLFLFFTLFFVIPVATIRDKNLKQPPSKHSMNKHCQPEKNKSPDRFILCYISILHHFLLTCSERSHSHSSTLCFDGEMDLSRQCGGEDTLLEISHLWLSYIWNIFNIYSLKCISMQPGSNSCHLSTVTLRSKKRRRPENRPEMKHYALW